MKTVGARVIGGISLTAPLHFPSCTSDRGMGIVCHNNKEKFLKTTPKITWDFFLEAESLEIWLFPPVNCLHMLIFVLSCRNNHRRATWGRMPNIRENTSEWVNKEKLHFSYFGAKCGWTRRVFIQWTEKMNCANSSLAPFASADHQVVHQPHAPAASLPHHRLKPPSSPATFAAQSSF